MADVGKTCQSDHVWFRAANRLPSDSVSIMLVQLSDFCHRPSAILSLVTRPPFPEPFSRTGADDSDDQIQHRAHESDEDRGLEQADEQHEEHAEYSKRELQQKKAADREQPDHENCSKHFRPQFDSVSNETQPRSARIPFGL